MKGARRFLPAVLLTVLWLGAADVMTQVAVSSPEEASDPGEVDPSQELVEAEGVCPECVTYCNDHPMDCDFLGLGQIPVNCHDAHEFCLENCPELCACAATCQTDCDGGVSFCPPDCFQFCAEEADIYGGDNADPDGDGDGDGDGGSEPSGADDSAGGGMPSVYLNGAGDESSP